MCEAFQRANAHLARENQEYGNALKERFITVADAARAVLRTVYDHDNVDREADAWRKRIAESGVELGEAVTGRQRRKFYPVPKIIRAFQERLERAGIVTTIRASRGEDILAACGLLAGRHAE